MNSISPYDNISLTTREKVVLLADNFDSVGELALHLGVSEQRIRQILKEEGITKFRRQGKSKHPSSSSSNSELLLKQSYLYGNRMIMI